MRGAAREAVVIHRERLQQSRCGKIGLPLGKKCRDLMKAANKYSED